MNGVYCNLILGFLCEAAKDTEKSKNYFETAFLKLQRVMPTHNNIRILVEKLFENNEFSIFQKLRKDFNGDEDKV